MSTLELVHDAVKAPAHYMGGGLEAINVIEDWGLAFHTGNAVKYILRSPKKGKREDLEKACRYLTRATYLDCVQIAAPSTRELTPQRVAVAFNLDHCRAMAVDEIFHAIERVFAVERNAHLMAAVHCLEAEIGFRVPRWDKGG